MQMLNDGEMVIADKGHIGEPEHILTPCHLLATEDADLRKTASIARSRHETGNRRLHMWGCLGQRWRHAVSSRTSLDCSPCRRRDRAAQIRRGRSPFPIQLRRVVLEKITLVFFLCSTSCNCISRSSAIAATQRPKNTRTLKSCRCYTSINKSGPMSIETAACEYM